MIERILENISEEELDILFPEKPYKYTSKGEALLKKYEWIPYIHNHRIDGLPIETIVIKSGNISMKNVSSILRVEILDFIEMLN